MKSGEVDGQLLRQARLKREWSLERLAGEVEKLYGRGVHPTMLSKIELGQRQPSKWLLKPLCRALGVRQNAVFTKEAA